MSTKQPVPISSRLCFPFWLYLSLLHRWGIGELLPDSCAKTDIRKLWAEVRRNLFRSNQVMAQRYKKGRIPYPFEVGNSVFCINCPLSDSSSKVPPKSSSRWRWPLQVNCYLTSVTEKLVDPITGNFVTGFDLSQTKPAGGM